MKSINLAILESNQVLLHGLRNVFHSSPIIELVSCTTCEETLINSIKELGVDVLIADVHGCDFDIVKLMRHVLKEYPTVKIILNGNFNPGPLIKLILRSGVSTYFIKHSTDSEELLRLVQTVHESGFAYTEVVTPQVIESTWITEANSAFPEFNDREKEVICLICEGQNKREIAASLCLSMSTVKYHMQGIFEKAEVNSTVELVIKSFNSRWIEIIKAEKQYRVSA